MLTFTTLQHIVCCMTKGDFISIWGSMAAFARAIDEGETTVRNWFLRGSIPAWHDAKIIEAAREAGRALSHEDMFALRISLSEKEENAA